MLLALEARAGRTYWRVDGGAYAEKSFKPFAATNVVVAVVGALDLSATTWFGAAAAYSVLVNFLPFSAAAPGGVLGGEDGFAFARKAYAAAAAGLPPAAGVRVEGASTSEVFDPALAPGDAYDLAQGPWRVRRVRLAGRSAPRRVPPFRGRRGAAAAD